MGATELGQRLGKTWWDEGGLAERQRGAVFVQRVVMSLTGERGLRAAFGMLTRKVAGSRSRP